ncbi:MAG: response regulator [Gammaproteobacteria bacterium]
MTVRLISAPLRSPAAMPRREGADTAEGSAPRPDLVLLDLNMPRMNGHETLAELRKIDTYRNLPVIVFTTSNVEQDVNQAYRGGANYYIAKPDSFEALCHAMDALQEFWFNTAICPRA